MSAESTNLGMAQDSITTPLSEVLKSTTPFLSEVTSTTLRSEVTQKSTTPLMSEVTNTTFRSEDTIGQTAPLGLATMDDLLAGMTLRQELNEVSLSAVNSVDSHQQQLDGDTTSYEMRELVVELIRETAEPLNDRILTLQAHLDQVYGLVCEGERAVERKMDEVTSSYTSEIKKLSIQCAQAISEINSRNGSNIGGVVTGQVKKEILLLEASIKTILSRMDMNTGVLAELRTKVIDQHAQIRTLTEVVQVQGLQHTEVLARLALLEQGVHANGTKHGLIETKKPASTVSILGVTTSNTVPLNAITDTLVNANAEDTAATLATKKRLTTAAIHTHFSGTGGDSKRDAGEIVYSFIMTVQEAVADVDQMLILSSQVLMAFMVPDSPGQSWLRLYQQGHRSNLKITLQELYKRFSLSTETLTDRFQACKRDVAGGENFQDYHDRLSNLAMQMDYVSKAYPEQGLQKPNQLKQFCSGVRDEHATVAIMKCTTLEEAKQALIALTNARTLAGSNTGVPKVVIDLTAITNGRGRQPSPVREKEHNQQQNQGTPQQQIPHNTTNPPLQQMQVPAQQGFMDGQYQNYMNGNHQGFDYNQGYQGFQSGFPNHQINMGNYRGSAANFRPNFVYRGGNGNNQQNQNNATQQQTNTKPVVKAEVDTANSGSEQPKTYACYTCGKQGHKAWECRSRGRGGKGGGRGGGGAEKSAVPAQQKNQTGAQQ